MKKLANSTSIGLNYDLNDNKNRLISIVNPISCLIRALGARHNFERNKIS